MYEIIIGRSYEGIRPIHDYCEGIDPETGELEFEENFLGYERYGKPHEEVYKVYTDYNEAKTDYEKLTKEFEDWHHWPWDNPSYSIETGIIKTEYTDGEDSEWFILKDKTIIIRKPDPTKNYDEMYLEFERKYNPYPVQMARYDAFRHALNDGLIDEDTYKEARQYFGKLWNYVGD